MVGVVVACWVKLWLWHGGCGYDCGMVGVIVVEIIKEAPWSSLL